MKLPFIKADKHHGYFSAFYAHVGHSLLPFPISAGSESFLIKGKAGGPSSEHPILCANCLKMHRRAGFFSLFYLR